MKSILIMITCLFTLNTFADEVKCKVVTKPIGIYQVQCPKGAYVEGVDVWSPPNTQYPYVRVACVVPEIICETIK